MLITLVPEDTFGAVFPLHFLGRKLCKSWGRLKGVNGEVLQSRKFHKNPSSPGHRVFLDWVSTPLVTCMTSVFCHSTAHSFIHSAAPIECILCARHWAICTGAVLCLVAQSCPTLCDPMDCSLPGSSVHEDSPGKKNGVGCHAFLQGIFPTKESNQNLLHCKWIIYQLSHQGYSREVKIN